MGAKVEFACWFVTIRSGEHIVGRLVELLDMNMVGLVMLCQHHLVSLWHVFGEYWCGGGGGSDLLE